MAPFFFLWFVATHHLKNTALVGKDIKVQHDQDTNRNIHHVQSARPQTAFAQSRAAGRSFSLCTWLASFGSKLATEGQANLYWNNEMLPPTGTACPPSTSMSWLTSILRGEPTAEREAHPCWGEADLFLFSLASWKPSGPSNLGLHHPREEMAGWLGICSFSSCRMVVEFHSSSQMECKLLAVYFSGKL